MGWIGMMSDSMNASAADRPVFIVGHSRSGSTLLATTLGRHPNMLAMPETHYFSSSYSGFFLTRIRARRSLKSLIDFTISKNIRLRDLNFSESEVRDYVMGAGVLNEKVVLDAIFRSVLGRSGKSRVIEKTPFHIEHIARILEWYPQAKVICILRDGRDAIQSLMNVPWTHSDPPRHAGYWKWCVRESLRRSKESPQSVTVVRYEDLVRFPEETLRSICNFIGEDFSQEMLKVDASVETVPDWEKGWKESSADAARSDNVQKWALSDSPDVKVWSYWLKDELELLRYAKGNFVVSALPFKCRVVFSDFAYPLWVFVRTHFVERKSKYRRALESSGGQGRHE